MKPSPTRPWLLPLCLFVGLTAVSFAAWTWTQGRRPGRLHYERGLDYAAAKQIPQAEQEWLVGVHDDPTFPDNYAQLGDLYRATGRLPQALAQYTDASHLSPKDGALLLHLAQTEEAAGDVDAASAAAGRAADLRPDDAEVLRYYGIVEAKLNRLAAAVPPLRRAHALLPDDADVLLYLVRAETQQDPAAAERDLTPFVQRHPENAEACYLMAYLLKQKPLAPGLLLTALDYAQRAHAGAPGNQQACVLLGQLYLEANAPSKALPLFQQAQRTAPFAQDVLHGLITCGTQLRLTSLAASAAADLNAAVNRHTQIALLQDRLHLHPDDTAAALEAARLEEMDENLPLAKTYYEQAARHAPQDSRARAALTGFLQRHRTGEGTEHSPIPRSNIKKQSEV